ncbi:hypothetical protein G4B88_001760, partial [Cannabis sativa]
MEHGRDPKAVDIDGHAREKRPQYHHNFKAGAMNSLGHEIAYVQFPHVFENLTENDSYSSSLRLIMETKPMHVYDDPKVDLRGFDSNGGPCYIGT